MTDSNNMQPGFAQAYPQLAWWVKNQGWIEMGYDERNESFIRVLDPGGMPWEGDYRYSTIDEAFAHAEAAVARFRREVLGKAGPLRCFRWLY